MTRDGAENDLRKRRRTPCACGVMALLICVLSLPMIEASENYWVAVDHPNASDSNNGLSLVQPFKTLSRAVQELRPGDTLFIKEGIYREPLVLSREGTAGSPIVVRAYPGDEGMVVIRGSDVVTGWTNDGGSVWSVSWQPLPLIDYPDGWIDYGEYSRRREMVFVNGNPLKQVLSQAELASGHFWMDDAAQRIRIHYSGDLNSNQVEISVRTIGVMARGRSYQVIRGLRVEHVTTDVFIGAMSLGHDQRVEDCRVEYNNGVGIEASSNTVLMRITSNHNGRLGIDLAGSNSLLESSETSHNSWRYGPRWEAGGIKVIGGMPSGNRIVRHTAKYNNGRGIWFDTTGSGNVVDASALVGNIIAGLEFEATIGPNWAINNVIVGTIKVNDGNATQTDGAGIAMYVARDTLIYNNTIVDVNGAGIVIGGSERDNNTFYPANTHVFNNIIVHPGKYAIRFWVWDLGATEEMLASHRFDSNLYFGADPTIYLRGAFSLAEWQENRGEDLDSLYAPPMFTNPASQDYSLQTGSPAIDAGRNFAEVSKDASGAPRPQGLRTDIGAFESPAPSIGLLRSPTRRLIP